MADNDSSNRTHILSITDKRYTSSSLCSRSILYSRIQLTYPAQVHFYLLICSITSMTIVFSLIQMTVYFSVPVCYGYSFHLCLCGCWVFLCPYFSAVCHCWKYVRVIDLSLQAGSNVTIEDVAVFGESCPVGRDSSLQFLVMVFSIWCSVPGRCSFQRSRSE